MIDKYKELKENIKFIAQYCNNEYNDVRVDEVLLGSLEVINRLQASQETLQKALAEETKNREIQAKRLREEREQKYEQIDLICKLRNELAEKNAEIESLNKLVVEKHNKNNELHKYLQYAEAEAIRGFVSRLEEILGSLFLVHHPCVGEAIDIIKKERTNDE